MVHHSVSRREGEPMTTISILETDRLILRILLFEDLKPIVDFFKTRSGQRVLVVEWTKAKFDVPFCEQQVIGRGGFRC